MRWTLLVVVLALSIAVPEATPAAQEQFDWIPQALAAARPRTGAPGIAAAIVKEGQLVWAGGDGLAHVEHNVPVRADTVFRVGSITKTITAVAVLQLVEKGLVGLDDPIGKYVPKYPKERSSVITVRHILTHTSGIRHYHYERGEKEGLPPQYFASSAEALNIYGVAEEPLLFTPGTAFTYSTYAFRLLGDVIEAASGLTWEAYLRDYVFRPAGMTSSRVEHPLEVVMRRAAHYRRAGLGDAREGIGQPWPPGAELINAPYVDFSYKWSAAAVLSTAEDLARYDIALGNGTLLKPDTVKLMHTPHVMPDGKRGPYGLGWRVNTDETGRTWVSHGGGTTGQTSQILRYPRGGISVSILSNVEGAENIGQLARSIAVAMIEGKVLSFEPEADGDRSQ
jgi:serine beta-lactamase-like protein LACTB, mitochondrial